MRSCELCGKSLSFGNTIARRGMAKYLGGVGVKITGVTRRKFKPNLQRVRFLEDNGTHRQADVCTRCIKSGTLKKPTKREIPAEVQKALKEKAASRTPDARRAARQNARKARAMAYAAEAKAKAAKDAKKGGQQPPPAAPGKQPPKK